MNLVNVLVGVRLTMPRVSSCGDAAISMEGTLVLISDFSMLSMLPA